MKVIEAKKKWCPFTDSGYMWTGVFGNVDKDNISPKCLASNCMAWVDTSTKFDIEHNDKNGYCQRIHNDTK